MPSNHISVKNGLRGSGGQHFQYLLREGHYAYISRDGKFEERGDLQTSGSGNMPAWAAHDPALFWQAADQYERANGRIYKEVVVSLPRALSEEQRVELVGEFVDHLLGDRHAYSWAIHNPAASDGGEQPHAHIMFTTRVNDGIARDPAQFFRRWNREHPEKGGAGKDPYFDTRQFIRDVREEWAMTANHFMSRHGVEARIEHRSYKTLGIELEPSVKVGIAKYGGERGVMEDVLAENRARSRRNGERLLINPAMGVHALTVMQSTFSRRDVEQFVFRNTDGEEQFRQVYARMMNSKELLALKDTGREGEWFTSTELHQIEERLVRRAQTMTRESGTAQGDQAVRDNLRATRSFNAGQDAAFVALTGNGQLVVVNGAAGTGKSYVLAAAREAFEADGLRVLGAALQGKTADDMQRDAGISSRTLHSLLSSIERGSVTLDAKTVVVIDEAGMVGSRQMEKLLGHAEAAGSRVRLVGDAFQLHAVDAGDAFRAVSREAAAAGKLESLTEIVRQKEAWQREASVALSRHDIGAAVDMYAERGAMQLFETLGTAREQLIAQAMDDARAAPGETQILLTHTNEQREALNRRIREFRQASGELGADQIVRTEERSMALAHGDRLMFLRNDYTMQVKNGTLATVERIEQKTANGKSRQDEGALVHVRLDDGRRLTVDTAQYGHFDHGYALTIHKSQGVTVDRAYVLATKSMHAELTYVSMTRHKTALVVAAGRDEFADRDAFVRGLSRADDKSFSAQHQLRPDRDRTPELGYRHTLGQRRAQFSSGPRPRHTAQRTERVVEHYADALVSERQARQTDKRLLAHEHAALQRTGAQLTRLDPAMRSDIDRQINQYDRSAWDALIALSGKKRARELVRQVRAAREDPTAGTAVRQELASGRGSPGLAADTRRTRKAFSALTPAEKAARRKEYMAEQHRKAGVESPDAAQRASVRRPGTDYGLD
ncbi:AAA family ATPase [Paraburkholderia ginsengisoli]|uniref:AAA family ATPase n=1 Tax=Paraburkholderia ginsengisoli TaxID=311231 RepID=A0A7T4TCB5_9BURK|nr:AAA family ATPase [Paraburkholderia ginsengisoli]QQC67875.1 AAA family ATPase [Paraburkholderia ginsengisoli]